MTAKPKLAQPSKPQSRRVRVATEYRNRPTLDKLEPYYSRHVSAMTTENLYSKSDIAAELAVRDKRIASLTAIRAAKLDPVFDSAVALAEYWEHAVLVRAHLQTDAPELFALLSANSAAVKASTDAEDNPYVIYKDCGTDIAKHPNESELK